MSISIIIILDSIEATTDSETTQPVAVTVSTGTMTEVPKMVSVGIQTDTPELVSVGIQASDSAPKPMAPTCSTTVKMLDEVAETLDIPHETRVALSKSVWNGCVSLDCSGERSPVVHKLLVCVFLFTLTIPQVHGSNCSWSRYYSVLSFLVNGQLFADYKKLGGMLGLQSCSHKTFDAIVEKLEKKVTRLAEWSCQQTRDAIKTRGDSDKWVASFDGFYLTRGHHSNNSSATLHDYLTGKIAWFCHRTKRGLCHNWEGTSGGAEGDMLNELLGKAAAASFVVRELITDKDSSMNAIYCQHFPEGTITYCANHCAKTLYKDLMKTKQNKCEVR